MAPSQAGAGLPGAQGTSGTLLQPFLRQLSPLTIIMPIIEERCYILDTAVTPDEYLKLYEAEGLTVQSEALGPPLGYFCTETGRLNAVVSLWRYESFEDRQARRANLGSRKAWQDYLAKVRPMIRQMNNRLLTPAHFSALR